MLISLPVSWLGCSADTAACAHGLFAGGYLVFLVLEAVRGGKKINADVEKGIMASGLLLLTTVGIVLIVRDTLNLAGISL
jgi:hypothetical protein